MPSALPSRRLAGGTQGQAEPNTGVAASAFPAIWATIAAVPAGTVASYGEIARRAGLPRRARLVAQALRAAPDELGLPWHRVLRSDGRIAFPPGSASFRRQKRLLEREGVRVSKNGRTSQSRTLAEPDLDAALWGHADS